MEYPPHVSPRTGHAAQNGSSGWFIANVPPSPLTVPSSPKHMERSADAAYCGASQARPCSFYLELSVVLFVGFFIGPVPPRSGPLEFHGYLVLCCSSESIL